MGRSIPKPFVLMLGGTSLTSGRLCNPPIPWTTFLYQEMRGSPECKGPVRILNTGKGGQTSDFGATQAALYAPLCPTHVLMEDFAINDCAIGPVSIPQATANFNSMVASYRAANPNVIIVHQTMSSASAGDANRTNLAAYYANGLANALANGLLSLDNYNGTLIVPGGWPKPLPVNITVPQNPFSITPTTGYSGMDISTTWNPSDKSASIALTNGNLTALSSANATGGVRATDPLSGLAHIQATVTLPTSFWPPFGVAKSTWGLANLLGTTSDGIALWADGTVRFNNVNQGSAGFTISGGDVLAIEVDVANALIYFMKGAVRSAAFPIGFAGPFYPALSSDPIGTGVTAQFSENQDGLHPQWSPTAFQQFSYPNIIAWARQAMADYWAGV